MTMTRRSALGAAALLASTPALHAAAPFATGRSAGWHRLAWQGFQLTLVSDGALGVGPPTGVLPGAAPAEIESVLREKFLPTDVVLLQQNALVANTGRHLVLFDTGMGESMGEASKMFGPTTGRLLGNLRAAGIDPAAIDLVALTHAHSDHCWGLVDAAGARLFPNAQVAISEADLRFWTDDANRSRSRTMDLSVTGAQRNILAYRDRLVMVRDGQEVVPGISAIAAPGHTVGHHAYALSAGGQVLVNAGDLAHHHVLQLRRPAWEFAFDSDRAQGAATRARLLDRLATERHAALFYHFPWPGIGHVVREGEGFAWVPTGMDVTSG